MVLSSVDCGLKAFKGGFSPSTFVGNALDYFFNRLGNKKKFMTWQQLENRVRLIASCKWACPANPEHINGVDVDCVAKSRPDWWSLVEITKENTLDKLRADLAKFASVRPYLFGKNIYADCYFVCEEEPPPSLIETGAGFNVKVLSASGFERHFLDYKAYAYIRSRKKFGSAVDPESGDSDPREYVPVSYIGVTQETSYTADDMVSLLRNGRKIILLGNYGTGKSRCIREIFQKLSGDGMKLPYYALAIDLRDQWGMKRATEIIQRHCDDLGLPEIPAALTRVLDMDVVCLLLDGFDEIGSQTWSDNPARLSSIRSESLLGVRDLLVKHKGGVLITGREHYFNSDEEMYQCLGLDPSNVILIRCADEFTDDEMKLFLARDGHDIMVPPWIPKRPLVCQLVARMDSAELEALNDGHNGEAAFWQVFITALCEREKRIHESLDPITIRRVLRRLARVTRDKAGDVGPITLEEMSRAFQAITGVLPIDESALMLQRLSSLGRVASETSDRRFVDQYILDGLRAEDIMSSEEHEVATLANVKWCNPLRRLGITLLSVDMTTTAHSTQYHRLMKLSSQRQNAVLAGDIVAAQLVSSNGEIDLDNVELIDSHITFLNFSGRCVRNLLVRSSVIDSIDITDSRPVNVSITNSIIQQVFGVTAAGGMPSWITECEVENYESVSTVARIRRAELSEEQRVFITIVKKLFFQPGAGREEQALLRGLGEAGKKKSADRILNRLRTEGMVDRFRGQEGWVYTPVRKYMSRMGRIMMELTLSNDPIWRELRPID